MESIFSYSDYRKYLADYYQEQKSNNPKFSHRFFALKAGFKTSNFLHLVITGQRNLTLESTAKITAALGLGRVEAEYFEYLVQFAQAADPREKMRYFERINAIRKAKLVKRIDQSQFDYYSNWIHPVLREAACFSPRAVDDKELGRRLLPPVPAAEVRKSLDTLESLGFLVRDGRRGYRQASPLVATDPDVKSLAVANYHIQTMALAAESITRVPAEKRELSTLTLGVRYETFKKIKERLREFQREILAMANEDNPEVVYQLNFHLFPMTDKG